MVWRISGTYAYDWLSARLTFRRTNYQYYTAVLIIGLCTFIISICGVKVGNVFGARYKNKAEFAGGVILILPGIKILLEYFGIKLF